MSYKFQKKKYQMTMSKILILFKIRSLNNNNLNKNIQFYKTIMIIFNKICN